MTSPTTSFGAPDGGTSEPRSGSQNTDTGCPTVDSPDIIPARRPDSLRFRDPRFVVVRCSPSFGRPPRRPGHSERLVPEDA